jgi:SAM-dependent methyltransferase
MFSMDFIEKLKRLVNNEYARRDWVIKNLKAIQPGCRILDAGCGSQRYRKYCTHLRYSAQDFGKFVSDERNSLTAITKPYEYGRLDYVGDIWDIDEQSDFFDAVLCTEVLEHIPYPNKTIKELARLLKPGGRLILTVPSNSLRHMDPYYYYSGFSDRYLQWVLSENNFEDIEITASGSYHAWLMVENARSIRKEGVPALVFLAPAFLYHFLRQRKPPEEEINTLCYGYHVTAVLR